MNFVLEGCYREDCGRERGAFLPQTAIFKPAGELHSNCFSAAPARCLLIELRDPDLVAPKLALDRLASTRDLASARSALALWCELAEPDTCSPLVIDQLALELFERMLGTGPPARPPSPRVHRATEALHDAPREAWTLSSLARHVGLHPSHLARAFRVAHGCTVGAYLRGLRVNELARSLALDVRAIASLAVEQGFADQSHATRAFKRWMGLTPAAFRRRFPSS